MNNKTWLCLGLLAAFFISGCGRQNSPLVDTVKLAVTGQPDVTVPAEKVAAIPYASAYLKVGETPRAFVVLGFAEAGRLKWLTADHNMVVTRHGRIVKTLGFGADLLHSSAAEQDPLALGLLNKETPLHWQHREVWAQQHQSGYTLNSTFVIKGHESVSIQGKAYDLMRVEEQVDVPAMNTQYINIFWLEPASGQVVQTHQYLGPGLPVVQFTILKPYASRGII